MITSRVLIVEGDAEAAVMLALLLSKHGLEAEVSQPGEDLVSRLSQDEFDFLLLEVRSAGAGRDLAQTIRRSSVGRRVKMISVSDSDRDAEHAQSSAAGFDAHIAKPLDMSKLMRVLSRPT